MNWKTWIHSLAAAGIGGAANALLGTVAMPDTFNFSHAGLINMAKIAAVGALVPVLTLLKQSPLPTGDANVKTPLIILAILALGMSASAQDVQNIYAAGASYSVSASPAIAGTALYAHEVTDSGLYAFTAVDALPNTIKPFTVNTNIGVGVAQKVATLGSVPVYMPTAAGISWNGSNTGWQWNGGVLASIHLKDQYYLMPSVRFLKSSVSGGTGYQPIVGVLFGWGK
jgi:hypothetical protein